MSQLGANLRAMRKKRGLTQAELAEAIGKSNRAVSNWETGLRDIDTEVLKEIARVLQCDIADLLRDDSPIAVPTKKASAVITVFGSVAAGIPLEMITDITDTEEIPAKMAEGGVYFGLRIKGDSMYPKIEDGDTVIVKYQPDAETGDIVIAAIGGEDAVCKKLFLRENGLTLVSVNPAYDPLVFTSDEVRHIPVTILGKVVEVRRKL